MIFNTSIFYHTFLSLSSTWSPRSTAAAKSAQVCRCEEAPRPLASSGSNPRRTACPLSFLHAAGEQRSGIASPPKAAARDDSVKGLCSSRESIAEACAGLSAMCSTFWDSSRGTYRPQLKVAILYNLDELKPRLIGQVRFKVEKAMMARVILVHGRSVGRR